MENKEFSMIQDLPIKDSSEDLLNRKSFANDLAKVLLKHFEKFSEYSFSIGIYGKWGSGKTSLLNMVLESVKKQTETQDQKVVIVEFNPWLCSDRQQMISQFFKQLALEIKDLKKPKLEKLWKMIAKYGDMVDLTSFIPNIGPILAVLGKVIISYARSETQKIENNLQKQKKNISDALEDKALKDDLKIIVAIDDIDRLTKEEIVGVFQLVKNLADFPNTVYLLAFDYNIVTKALEEVQGGDGREYLEKVIQVPFQIPAPNMETIHNVFLRRLKSITSEDFNEKRNNYTWEDLFQDGIKPLIKSLRDINRFANVFYLKYLLLSNETNVFDLIGLTCLQVFEPNIYSELPAMKSFLCGTSTVYYFHTHDKSEYVKKEVENFIKDVATDNQESIRCILGFLFPIVSDALTFNIKISINLNGATRYNKKDLLLNRKIASEACFDRYFSLTLEADTIPSSLITQMITEMSGEELINQFNELGKDGKINRFIRELIAYVDFYQSPELPENRATLFVEIITQQWMLLTFYKEEGLIPGLSNLFESLLNILKESKRFEFLLNLFNKSDSNLSALAILLDTLEEPHGLNYRKTVEEDRQLISLSEVKSLEEIFIKRATDALDDWGKEDRYDNNLGYLWKLEKLNSDSNPMKKIDLSKDKALAFVISYCTDIVINNIGNAKFRGFQLESFKRFLCVDDAYLRMENYVKSEEFFGLPKEIQMDVVSFLLLCKQPQPKKEEEQIMKELKRLEEERKRNDRL